MAWIKADKKMKGQESSIDTFLPCSGASCGLDYTGGVGSGCKISLEKNIRNKRGWVLHPSEWLAASLGIQSAVEIAA